MIDHNLIDNWPQGARDFLPCRPIRLQPPGFIWGVDNKTLGCPPGEFRYKNTDPDKFDHTISVQAVYKDIDANDNGIIFQLPWIDSGQTVLAQSGDDPNITPSISFKFTTSLASNAGLLLIMVGGAGKGRFPAPKAISQNFLQACLRSDERFLSENRESIMEELNALRLLANNEGLTRKPKKY